MRTKNEVKLLVNQLGRKFKDKSLQFKFVRDLGNCLKKNDRNRHVIIFNFFSKKTAKVSISSLQKGQNPFNNRGRGETILCLEKNINKLGKTSKNKLEHYRFVSLCKNIKYSGVIVKVENSITKERKTMQLKKLKEGRQPFRQDIDYRELKLQNKIYKELLKYKNQNICVVKEYSITNHGRIDFYLKNKVTGQFIGIELKHDKSYWQEKDLTKQIQKYHSYFAKIDGYKGTFLCSSEGKYGMHISKIDNLVKRII